MRHAQLLYFLYLVLLSSLKSVHLIRNFLHCFPQIWGGLVFLLHNYSSVLRLVAVNLTIINLR